MCGERGREVAGHHPFACRLLRRVGGDRAKLQAKRGDVSSGNDKIGCKIEQELGFNQYVFRSRAAMYSGSSYSFFPLSKY